MQHDEDDGGPSGACAWVLIAFVIGVLAIGCAVAMP
jgi:hypothetical protein